MGRFITSNYSLFEETLPFNWAFFTKSMTVCVIASTIPGISMNPILAIAQDTLF
ncbi:unnamed protein product [Spirodela intermedia]|uniref:Uncharacterized protein n=1 Tax=Spirodela intermedia TaxID=51605 RepID=A0A7I8K9D0_SPIIN|nr:unnamed protein product [Spirodela intermedia]